MSQLWTIVEVGTGKVLYDGFRTPSEGAHPKDWGWDWNPATQKATRIDKDPITDLQTFGGTVWADDLAKVKAVCIQRVKDDAETRKMMRSTPGGMKKAEYAEKRNEVILWDSLGGTVAAILLAFDALPAGRRATRFAHAIADAAAFGDKPADAIERFRGGMSRAASVPIISAVEAKACVAIRAATTPAAAWAAVPAPAAWPA